MFMQSRRVVLAAGPFDELAVLLDLTRRTAAGEHVPSNSKIGRHLNVSHSTVSRARSGRPVGHEFVGAALRNLPVTFEEIFRVA